MHAAAGASSDAAWHYESPTVVQRPQFNHALHVRACETAVVLADKTEQSLVYSRLAQLGRGFDSTVNGSCGVPMGRDVARKAELLYSALPSLLMFLIWLYTILKDETLTQSSSAFSTAQIIDGSDQRLVCTMLLPRGSKTLGMRHVPEGVRDFCRKPRRKSNFCRKSFARRIYNGVETGTL